MNDQMHPSVQFSRQVRSPNRGPINRKYTTPLVALVGVLFIALFISWLGGRQLTPTTRDSLGGGVEALGTTIDASSETAHVSILDVLGKLSVAILCIYGVILGLRWWRDRTVELQDDSSANGQPLKIKQEARLSEHQRLYVVEIGKRMILIASNDTQLVTLADLPIEEVDPDAELYQPPSAPPLRIMDLNVAATDSNRPSQRAERLQVQSRRAEEDWPARRDALIKALQKEEA